MNIERCIIYIILLILDTCIASFSSFLLLFIGLIMYLFVIKSFFCNNNNNATKATNCSILDMVLRANAISTVTSKKVMSIMGNTGEQPFFNTTEVLQQISKKSLLYTILLSHKQINGTHYRTLTYTIIEINFIYMKDLTNRLTLQRQGKWRH